MTKLKHSKVITGEFVQMARVNWVVESKKHLGTLKFLITSNNGLFCDKLNSSLFLSEDAAI